MVLVTAWRFILSVRWGNDSYSNSVDRRDFERTNWRPIAKFTALVLFIVFGLKPATHWLSWLTFELLPAQQISQQSVELAEDLKESR